MITIDIPKHVVAHLDELCELTADSRARLLVSLIEREFSARGHLGTAECPWEITLRAKQEYLSIVSKSATPENLDEATDVLEAAAIDAVTAEREGRRMPTPQDSGALRYRGPKPRRLMLHVVDGDESARPQLVHVRVSGARR